MGQTPVRRSLHDLAEDVIPVRGAGSVRRAGNPPDKRVTSAHGANSMKIILLRNPKHVAPARGQPPRTQENPYPIYSRLLRVTASAHGEPFLRVFPAHPAAGVTSYPETPSQGATPNTGHWPPRMQKITPIYSRVLRPPRTRSPLFTHLPGSPCGGYNLVPGAPSQRATPDAGRWNFPTHAGRPCSPRCSRNARPELPHTRGKAASVCAGRR